MERPPSPPPLKKNIGIAELQSVNENPQRRSAGILFPSPSRVIELTCISNYEIILEIWVTIFITPDKKVQYTPAMPIYVMQHTPLYSFTR